MLQKGDRVRMLSDSLSTYGVSVGTLGTVKSIRYGAVKVLFDGERNGYIISELVLERVEEEMEFNMGQRVRLKGDTLLTNQADWYGLRKGSTGTIREILERGQVRVDWDKSTVLYVFNSEIEPVLEEPVKEPITVITEQQDSKGVVLTRTWDMGATDLDEAFEKVIKAREFNAQFDYGTAWRIVVGDKTIAQSRDVRLKG